jgi:hypothetical protein
VLLRDVDGCGDEVESVMAALMSFTFSHFLGIILIFGENEN